MRRIATLAAVVAAALVPCPPGASATPPAAGAPLPVRYGLDVAWVSADRTLVGTESIEFRNAGPGTLSSIWLRLWPNDSIPGQADGCRERRIRIVLLSGARVERYAVACSAVRLRLAPVLDPGADTTLHLRFSVRVPTNAAEFGRSAGVDLLGRAIPILAVRDEHGWHLNPDTEIGDPSYSLTAAWTARIRVPSGLTVASTGVQLSDRLDPASRQRVFTLATAHARDFGLAIGPLRRISETVDGVDVRVFAAPGHAASEAHEALRHAVAAVRRYTSWYGSYGSPELDVVIAKLGDNSQELPEIVFTDADVGTVAHEVAHEWFYGIVGDDQYNEPWLDEAFAAWNEEQFAPGSYACSVRSPLGPHRGGLGLGLSYYEHHPEQYDDVIYRGGECALTKLEQMLGRRRFLSMLRAEVARYRYGVIHTAGFLALVAQTDGAVARRWEELVGFAAP